ncbi:MAG: hypothetical protein EAY68_09025 [Bacteroidetes bacterium]|nr:MAG: hypothetical protein EAY68_09025 [Bacteroidota bacterium]
MSSTSLQPNMTSKYQLSWGNILLLVFIVFVLLMAMMVYKAVNTQYDLVSKDYYAQELRHQHKMDAINNVARLGSISISKEGQQLQLHLPQNMQSKISNGYAWLYCPTDAKKDVTLPLIYSKPTGTYIVDITHVTSGNYIIKTNWEFENRNYYWEKQLYIAK